MTSQQSFLVSIFHRILQDAKGQEQAVAAAGSAETIRSGSRPAQIFLSVAICLGIFGVIYTILTFVDTQMDGSKRYRKNENKEVEVTEMMIQPESAIV
mmetsp:Transcript_19564/g.28592  ORF Transcript_19564/g.28592 Transcript_19564/m.28592 type:complete len:98 (-) Transcript_19564:546-839(-)|eukprot:CAMPEP_0197237138 /NCGR_PEP_ID=MMETSP1429-20130617/4059_1 /TAXON_ID=49237 /ORGANISM="Chaetoceros  sp., Strain UNC1202" /LENGTH=97 /DNA_ID=CAMNT_0042696077 /DNA_START=34 /DNA_END=327 /DNA_ORIENTATION=+